MSKTPFMPLWNGDLLADTLEMDATEFGAFMLLIIAQWQRKGESLPSDEKRLQRVARVGRAWPKVWSNIQRFFDTDDQGVYSRKCRILFQNVASKTIVNSQNGARGGAAKALKNIDADLANATNSLQRNPSIPEPEPYKDTQSKDCATGVAESFWHECVLVLTSKGRTDRQARALLGKWTKGKSRDEVKSIVLSAAQAADPIAVIEAAMSPPKPVDRHAAAVQLVMSGNPSVCRGISPNLARDILGLGLVTIDELKKAHVAH